MHTADVVLFARDADRMLRILLIQRADDSDAYPGDWALPGGKRKHGEYAAAAARRELAEETGISTDVPFALVGRYDSPGRDPRGPVVTTAFAAMLDHMPTPCAADDAQAAEWVPVPLAFTEYDLAFDHADILTRALHVLRYAIEGT